MPSRKWYAVALVIFVLGGAAAGLYVWSGLAALEAKLTRFVVPGTVELALAEPGTYTIFHEERAVLDGRYYASEDVAGMRIQVVSAATATPFALTAPGYDQRYSFGGHSGVAVFTFEVPAPEHVRLIAGFDDGRSAPQLVLTVGHGFMGNLFATVFATIGIAFAAFGIAAAIACVTYIKRRRASERQRASGPAAS
jgi:hypothetical protein